MRWSQHCDALEKRLHARIPTRRHIGEAITCAHNTVTHWTSNYMRCQHCDTLEKQFHALSKHSDALQKQLHALTTLRHIGEAITCTVNTATHWRSNYTRSQNTATQHCDTLCDSPARPKATCCANYIFAPKRPACQSQQDTHEILYNTSDSQNKIRRQGIQSPTHPQFESPSHIQIVEQEVHRVAEELVPHVCGFQPRNSLAVPDRSMQTNNANHDNHIPKGNLTLKEAHCLSNGCCN